MVAPVARRVIAAVLVSVSAVYGDAAAPGSATQEALLALDTDGSGKVEKREIEAFAQAQGVSSAEVQNEFKDLDTNGDGELSVEEISSTLSQPENLSPGPAPAGIAPAARVVVPDSAVAAPMAAAPGVAALPTGTGAAGVLVAMDGSASSRQDAMEVEAQQQVAKALAQVFAHSAADLLAGRSQDVDKATKLEEAAKSLRGKSVELRRTVAGATAQAAKEAMEAVLHENMSQIKELDEAAAKATKEAEARSSHAKSAMQLALKAQSDMRALVNKLDVPGA